MAWIVIYAYRDRTPDHPRRLQGVAVAGAQGQLHAVTPNAEHVLQEGEGE